MVLPRAVTKCWWGRFYGYFRFLIIGGRSLLRKKWCYYELVVKPGPGPLTWTLKNLDPEKSGPWKTWETAGCIKKTLFGKIENGLENKNQCKSDKWYSVINLISFKNFSQLEMKNCYCSFTCFWTKESKRQL